MYKQYRDKIALAMYTAHKECYRDLEGTVSKLEEMGYSGLEYYGEQDLFDKEIIKRVHRETGVKLAGWHTEWIDLQPDRYEKTVSYLEDVQCPILIVPCLGGEWNIGHTSEEECKDRWLFYIDWLNELYEKLRRRGIRLGYHNHNHEFKLVYDGERVFDMLFKNLDRNVILEFDTGRAIFAGVDCCSIIREYSYRDIIVHAKPYGLKNGYDDVLGSDDDMNNIPGMINAYDKDFLWMMVESENLKNSELTNCSLNAEYLKNLFK